MSRWSRLILYRSPSLPLYNTNTIQDTSGYRVKEVKRVEGDSTLISFKFAPPLVFAIHQKSDSILELPLMIPRTWIAPLMVYPLFNSILWMIFLLSFVIFPLPQISKIVPLKID